MRSLRPSRGSLLLVLALAAFAFGSAGLGLAISNRLAAEELHPIRHHIGIVHDMERSRPAVPKTPALRSPPMRIKGLPGPHPHSRVWQGPGKPHRTKIIDEKHRDTVIGKKGRD